MVSRDENMHSTKFAGNHPHHILDLLDRFLTCSENRCSRMSCLVDGIVVNVDHIHTAYQGAPLRPLHADHILIFQGDAFGIGGFQDLIPPRCLG